MDDNAQPSSLEPVALEFEQLRPRLRAVARRLVGSTTTDADDAVQEAWIRLSRSDRNTIENLEAWLVTTVGRVALNQLRSRSTRRELPLDEQPVARLADDDAVGDPEQEVVLLDTVGVALQVVLDTLTPAERLAYVLHDVFGVPFEQVAVVLDRSADAARKLASRGRRRVRGLQAVPDDPRANDRPADQAVVEAFLAAARDGSFEALLAVLDPDVVQRTTGPHGEVVEVRGADVVAGRAEAFTLDGLDVRPSLVDDLPGWAAYRGGRLFTTGRLAISDGRITTMTIDLVPGPGTRLAPMTAGTR